MKDDIERKESDGKCWGKGCAESLGNSQTGAPLDCLNSLLGSSADGRIIMGAEVLELALPIGIMHAHNRRGRKT